MQETKSPVKKITLIRAEGQASECGKAFTCAVLTEADSCLQGWSKTAPANGGYDRCDFEIEWQNGSTYKGTYFLEHWSRVTASLTGHLQHAALFYTARFTPTNMTQERHEEHLGWDRCSIDRTMETYEKLITTCNLGLIEIPAPLFTVGATH